MPQAGRSVAGALAVVLAAAAGTPACHAQGQDGGVFTLQVENDTLFRDEDRHYTHGMRIAYLSSSQDKESPASVIARWLPCFGCAGEVRYGVSLGQSIFTPDEITRSTLVEDDRPYAGWLYGTLSLLRGPAESGASDLPAESRAPRTRRTQFDRLESFELTLGIVGPSSQAEDSQEIFHDLVNAREPRGWDNQLEDEPGIVLSYETLWRSPIFPVADDVGLDVLPSLGASLGNVFTFAEAGLMVRFGNGLNDDFGPPSIRPGLPGSEYYEPDEGFGWYVFAGAGARAVARNIFLDGNSFRDSHSVDKEPFVFDFKVGIVFSLWGRARLAVSNTFRTREFEGQDEADEFGAVTLSFRF